MKHILITGGAGFIGSHYIDYILTHDENVIVINLDCLTYAADINTLKKFEDHERYIFQEGNICDTNLLQRLFTLFDIQGVVHFAAESHVDNSIAKPEGFLQTNIMGTFSLLNVAYKYWMSAPHTVRDEYRDCRFHHISTDEVYGSLGDNGLFREDSAYAPNSPYSASKASSDFIVRAYHHTYGLNVTTSNCSNNYGPHQHDEKLIPTIIRNAINGQQIPIYGDGKNIRDWLYVEDHCSGIDLVYREGKTGETYNIGGYNEKTNLEIAHRICAILDQEMPLENGQSYENFITFVDDRAGHDRRYAIDSNKITKELGWMHATSFDQGLTKTVHWYLNKYK